MATYTVQDDDTLGKIASKVKRSKKSLHLANHGVLGSNPDADLAPGTVLTIPANGSEEDDDDGA